jgi:hypothetical protein
VGIDFSCSMCSWLPAREARSGSVPVSSEVSRRRCADARIDRVLTTALGEPRRATTPCCAHLRLPRRVVLAWQVPRWLRWRAIVSNRERTEPYGGILRNPREEPK